MDGLTELRQRIETYPRGACPCCDMRLQAARVALHVAAKLATAREAADARGQSASGALFDAATALIGLAKDLVGVEDGG